MQNFVWLSGGASSRRRCYTMQFFVRCYTLQCFLQLVSQLVPQRTRLRLKAYFYWLIAQNIARQVARGVLHCAMLKKFVAALPQSLRKVELDSTSCNACCSKNVARLDDCGVCYTTQFLVQLVSQQKLRDKLHEKLHSVTPP